MKVISEKKEIVGTLSTLVGRFLLLELAPIKFHPILSNFIREKGGLAFHVLNDEGFDCWIAVHGDMVIIPSVVPTLVDVKRVLTGEEERAEIHSEINKKLQEIEAEFTK